MPIPFIWTVYAQGWPTWLPSPWVLLRYGGAAGGLAVFKRWMAGALTLAGRDLHGRVIIVTGGTSGIGAAATHELARRGAQVVLLTHHSPTDAFLVEFVEDVRSRANNQLVYAEQVDLASLHSVRRFATRWIDNAPPRRLDGVVLCAATLTPAGSPRALSDDGVEATCAVNYLANFHLLGLLSPALRAQPFDRDVRIILPTCSSYVSSPPVAELTSMDDEARWSPGLAYARSKMALVVFGHAYQKHLDAHKRPDGLPNNARVVFVDPGLARTPGTRRWLTRGSLVGLLVYLALYPLVWLVLKSPFMAAQSVLHAAMDAALGRGAGGRLVKECIEVDFARADVRDEVQAKRLWEWSDGLVERAEKRSALARARRKKEEEKRVKEAKEAEQVHEIEALVDTIKKGREAKAQMGKGRKRAIKFSEKAGKAVE